LNGSRTARPAFLIAGFCLALVLNLTGFMTLAAVLPQLMAEWALTGGEAGWLGGIYFAGYVAAVPVLTSLTDRFDARRICLASSLVAAIASLAFAATADGFWPALIWRFLAGAGLGGTYMPGLKALTDRLPAPAQGRAVTYYSAVFALGTALSFLTGGEIAEAVGWHWSFVAAGAGCVLGSLIVAILARPVAPDRQDAAPGMVRGFRNVLKNREAMAYIVAFFGYAWEVFAFRVWIVAFIVYAQANSGTDDFFLSPTGLATLFALAGVFANFGFGELTLARNRRTVLMTVSILSAVAAVTVGIANDIAYAPLIALCFVFAMLASGRNAPTTAGSVAAAAHGARGTTMAVHATIGYAGGIVGPLAVGIALDLAGGIGTATGWIAAFCTMAAGAVISFLALLAIPRRKQ